MGYGMIFDILNKLFPSRKGALVDQLNALTVKYQQALDEGRDTDAAILKKQLIQLRQKAGLTDGDI
jgi:hypothetical protein